MPSYTETPSLLLAAYSLVSILMCLAFAIPLLLAAKTVLARLAAMDIRLRVLAPLPSSQCPSSSGLAGYIYLRRTLGALAAARVAFRWCSHNTIAVRATSANPANITAARIGADSPGEGGVAAGVGAIGVGTIVLLVVAEVVVEFLDRDVVFRAATMPVTADNDIFDGELLRVKNL
jgi:hypothetical protein